MDDRTTALLDACQAEVDHREFPDGRVIPRKLSIPPEDADELVRRSILAASEMDTFENAIAVSLGAGVMLGYQAAATDALDRWVSRSAGQPTDYIVECLLRAETPDEVRDILEESAV